MLGGSEDTVRSLACSLAALFFLVYHGCPLTAGLLLPPCLYFLRKLWAARKVKTPQDFHVIVIGAGPGGICMGKRLNDLGIRYTILEKHASLGGTWYINRYPGCACDVPSYFYSFSFFQNPYWSSAFASHKEILAYLETVASRFSVYPHIRFGQTVRSSRWDAGTSKWTVETTGGKTFTGDVMVSALGLQHLPIYPSYPGREQFQGDSFHTAAWQNGYDPSGKRIAVLGTGSSGVQVMPVLADMGPRSVTVFQRTPCMAPPKGEFIIPEWYKTVFALCPPAQTLYRWRIFWTTEHAFWSIFTVGPKSRAINDEIRQHIKATVKDQQVAAKLTPNYNMGSKRPTPSDNYYQAFNKDFVHLNTNEIERLTEKGVKTVDGTEHEFDTLVYATGFDVVNSAKGFEQLGLQGSLDDDYGSTPAAYLGMTHFNHPNFFRLYGPGTVNSSVIYMIECQVDYAVDGIRKMLESGAKSMVVKQEVFRRYEKERVRMNKGSTFADQTTASYYRSSAGVNWVVWPLLMCQYWWSTATCNKDDFHMEH